MPHNQRMDGARPLGVGVAFLEALTQLTRGVARCIVLARKTLDPGFECLWKLRVGFIQIVEERLSAG